MGSPQAPSSPNSNFTSSTLYVGDLENNVSEAQLYEIFNQVGPVVSIRVCRDAITRRSLGYAYVNYSNTQDATRALDLLNFQPINGKPVRIMYSQRDPSLRKSGAGNIFIKNLDRGIDNKALYDTFQAFGAILSAKVATDQTGESKGYGYVQFEAHESAQQAIEKVNGMLLNDKQVYVGPFVKRNEREPTDGASKFQNVFVKNLSPEMTEKELNDTFAQYGPISSVALAREGDGGKSKGFGFVNFESADDAAKAVEALHGKVVDEKVWYVDRAQTKAEREQDLKNKFEQERKERMEKYAGANLYLKNLDEQIDDDKLRELFSEFGNITSCKIMKEPSGTSRGSGFVAFASPEEATKAVTEMNGKMIYNKPLYVALAERKEDRRARLQAQFAQRAPMAAAPAPMPMYSQPPMGQQVFFGQAPPPGLLPPHQVHGQPGFGFQQPVMGGMRPGMGQVPGNYFMPVVPRQGGPISRSGGRRGQGGPMQSTREGPPGGRGDRNLRYSGNARNVPAGAPEANGGAAEGPSAGALASSLAAAPPEQRRTMLGEQLYPLVDQLEHDHAGKVTGMLLEMDQTEVLHLIESPEALRAKVSEALEVLRMAQAANVVPPTEQMSNLSVAEPSVS